MLRVFQHYVSSRKVALFAAESAAMLLAAMLGATLVGKAVAPAGATPLTQSALALLAMAAILVGAFQFALYAWDLYDLKVANEDRSRGRRMLKAAGIAAGATSALLFAVSFLLPLKLPAGTVLGAAMGSVAGVLALRLAFHIVVGEPRRVLIIGNGGQARALVESIEACGEDLFEVSQLVDPRSLGSESARSLAEKSRADYVVVACDDARGSVKAEELIGCRFDGRKVYDASGFSERILRRLPIQTLRASQLAFSDELTLSAWRRFSKRAFDLAVASALFICAAPAMAILAIVIKLDSKGPVFYRQERTGMFGKTYRLWKFRSMRTDAEKNGAVWAKQNDDRVTRVGKFIRKTRMDEIPQVFNVLFGDMSFVGPRPERPVFIEQLKEQIPFYGLREGVKPGITGWAQIRYPYGASVEDAKNKLEFDLYYVKNGSLFLDLAIIFHTVRHVLMGRGAR